MWRVIFILFCFANLTTSDIFHENPHAWVSAKEHLKDPKVGECFSGCRAVKILGRLTCASDGYVYGNHFQISCMNRCLQPFGEELTPADPEFCLNAYLRKKNDSRKGKQN